MHGLVHALFNPKMSNLIQKCRPCTGNLNSEKPGNSENVFLHWGDVYGFLHGLLHGHYNQAGLWEHH